MENMIELTEEQLREVAGGSGMVSFSFTNTASGPTTAAVIGTLTIQTTTSSASLSGMFSSSST
jgi:hypothetical protein